MRAWDGVVVVREARVEEEVCRGREDVAIRSTPMYTVNVG